MTYRRSRHTLAGAVVCLFMLPFLLGHSTTYAVSQEYLMQNCWTKVSGFEHYGKASASTRNQSGSHHCGAAVPVYARVTGKYKLWPFPTQVVTKGPEYDGYVRASTQSVNYDWHLAEGSRNGSWWAGFYR